MKGITTIIVIIAIIVVAFFMLKDGTTPETSTEDSVEQAQTVEGSDNISDVVVEIDDTAIDTTAEIIVVTYSNEGFAPKEIDVAVGQTVRFVNESSGNMWVASAVHPSHTVLPEFDEKKSIGNGEVYEFTFTKAGAWEYHNHVKPSAGGKVNVE